MVEGNSPLVSVVIPTHNRPDLVQRAIHSVLGQTYQRLECIVIDDGSFSDTALVVGQMADPRIRFTRHETSRGASAARNTGISLAQGSLIAFLDDDDEWLPKKLEKQVSLIGKLPPEVGLVYCWMDYFDSDGHIVREHHPTHSGYVFPLVLDRQRIGGCPTLLVQKAVFGEIGGFDETLPRGNDGDFIRRVCAKYEVDLVPDVLVHVHVAHGHEQITRDDIQGIRNAIKGHLVKLEKFQDKLIEFPKQTANIYASLAYHYGQLGELKNCALYFLRAFTLYPISKQVLSSFIRTLALPIKSLF